VYDEGFPGDGVPSEDYGDERQFVNRWWFNFNSRVPRAVADSSGKLVYLYGNPVRLSTEQQVKGSFGTGDTTVSATRFAEDFTEHMEVLGKHYPNIAELKAMYRLYDLMRHLRQVSETVPPNVSYWVKDYQPPYEGPPPAMPTLSITRDISILMADERETRTWNVRGGVLMRVGITRESLKRAPRPVAWLSQFPELHRAETDR
jgi:hypothetical protein